MRIVFLGAAQHTKPEGSSIYVASDRGNYNFAINCTPDFLNQSENIDDIDFLLLQNPDEASIGGISQLDSWMKKKDFQNKIPIYMDEVTMDTINLNFKELNHIEPRIIVPGLEFAPMDSLLIEPFYYTTEGDMNSVGYRFKNTVYAPNIIELPFESMKHFKNASIIISDSENTVDLVNKFHPEVFVTTTENIKVGNEVKTNIMTSKKNLELTTTEVISETLSESREAINLASPHAELIYQGSKSLMVKDKFYKKEISKPLYLLQNKYCYGIIRLKLPDRISVKEFKQLSNYHKITEEQRHKWWPNKEVLYSYRFDVVKLFEQPVPIESPEEFSEFIKDFKFSHHINNKKKSNKAIIKHFARLGDEEFDLHIVKNQKFKKVKYKQMRPKKRCNTAKDAITSMSQVGKVVVEKCCYGDRVFLTKHEDGVKIINSNQEDVSNLYPQIINDAQILSNKDIVLDCIVVGNDLVCFDIIKFGEEVMDLEWFERKQLLHSLHFTNSIKEMPSIIADSVTQVEQAMILMSKLSNSTGAILKRYDNNSGYVQDESDRWIEFSEGITSTSTPGIPSVQGKKIQKKKPIKPGQQIKK